MAGKGRSLWLQVSQRLDCRFGYPRKVCYRQRDVINHPSQKGFIALKPGFDCLCIKKTGVVLALKPQPTVSVRAVDEQLEVFEVARVRMHVYHQPRERLCGVAHRLVDVEHHTDEWQPARIAIHGQFLEKRAVRQCLMFERVHKLCGGLRQQGFERLYTVNRTTHRQQVDTMTNQAVQPAGCLACSRHANDHILLTRKSIQQCRKAREQQGKAARTVLRRDNSQFLQQALVKQVVYTSGGKLPNDRPLSVRWQIQGRQRSASEFSQPVAFMLTHAR